MVAAVVADEYMEKVRPRLCARCVVRLPRAPPCEVRGVACGVERHLAELIEISHAVSSSRIDPLADAMESDICTCWELRESRGCPCQMKYLLPLAIEEVDRRRRVMAANWSAGT